MSIVSGFTCAVLAVAKFMLGRVLTSRALITDGRVNMHTHTHTDPIGAYTHLNACLYAPISPLSTAKEMIKGYLMLSISDASSQNIIFQNLVALF